MPNSFLHVKNIYKSFAGVKALQNIDFEIKEGEVRCLVGENGCGKSTLIKIISGVYEADSGVVEMNGKTYTKLSPMDAIDNGVQVIYQDFSIFPNLTVAENIAMNTYRAQRAKMINWKEIKKTATEALQKLGVKMDLDQVVEKLSVADKQLIAICRALLHGVKLIIMDEPTTALTKKEVNALLSIIHKLKEQGIAIVFVSHKLDEVFEVSDTVTIMRNGEVVTGGLVSDFDMSKFVYYMTGRDLTTSSFVPAIKDGEELLRLENLSATGGFKDVSFTLKRGEIIGVTGLLGSGRSELAQVLFGYNQAASGKVFVRGKEVNISDIPDAMKNKIAYVPEDRLTEGLFLTRSISLNIVASGLDKYVKRGKVIDLAARKECANHWVKEFTIKTPDPENPVNTLSGGNQQRVVLGKWIATEPDILILNCPTVGVDIGSKFDIHNIVRDLANQGMGVIIISDDVSEVITNCNRIFIMKHGRLVSSFTNEEVTAAELDAQLS